MVSTSRPSSGDRRESKQKSVAVDRDLELPRRPATLAPQRPILSVTSVKRGLSFPVSLDSNKVEVDNLVLGGVLRNAELPESVRAAAIELSDRRKFVIFCDPLLVSVLEKGARVPKLAVGIRWLNHTTGIPIYAPAIEPSLEHSRFTSFELGKYCEPLGWQMRLFLVSKNWPAHRDMHQTKGRWAGEYLRPAVTDLDQAPSGDRLVAVEDLKAGQALIYEYAFRFVDHWWKTDGEALANGKYGIPLQRPRTKLQWSRSWRNISFLEGITSQQWPLMLRALQHQYFGDLFDTTGKANARLSRRIDEERQKVPQDEAITGKNPGSTDCFSGYDGQRIDVTYKSSGRIRFLWELKTAQSGKVYVVDSPQVGAFYLFDNRDDAEGWAAGKLNYLSARKKCIAWVPHIQEEWEEEVDALLLEAGVVKPA